MALYAYMRQQVKAAGATASVGAAAGISTTSMAACCAHHVADVLPVLGVSAISLFLVRYQLAFILIGIFSNLGGILIMLGMMKKHNLYGKKSRLMQLLFRLDFRKALYVAILFGVVAVAVSFARAV